MKTDERRNKYKNRLRRILYIFQLFIFVLCIVGIPLLIYLQHPEVIANFKSLDSVNALLDKYQSESMFVYIGFQLLQVVISVIPGQMLQLAAGYAFAFWLGLILTLIGVALGTSAAFGIARILGKKPLRFLFGDEKFRKYERQLQSKKAYIVLFVIFFIPGMPKDMVTYAAGVSSIRFDSFIILSLVARTPAMAVTIMMGSMIHKESYFGVIVLSVLAVAIFLACIIKRNQLMELVDKAYDRMVRK